MTIQLKVFTVDFLVLNTVLFAWASLLAVVLPFHWWQCGLVTVSAYQIFSIFKTFP